LPRSVEQLRRRVDANHLGDVRADGEVAGDRADSAADLQGAGAGRERHFGQIGITHGALRGIGGANLQCVGEPVCQIRICRSNARVHVGHGALLAM
jgi:hypothetical protein